jgi:hypothetical protein
VAASIRLATGAPAATWQVRGWGVGGLVKGGVVRGSHASFNNMCL